MASHDVILSACQTWVPYLLQAKRIWVGYSGGVDSHVLLHALAHLRKQHGFQLIAVHVHHGLMSAADAWTEHCDQVCRSLEVPIHIQRIHVKKQVGESLEALARVGRYQVFKELLMSDDVLLTAHHIDDQAETCLLQFLRGSGPKGLSAMPHLIPFAKGLLIRPFLSVSRQEILNYAESHHLKWIEDDSNHDERFTRNFLRYRILPLLKTRWPHLSKTLLRVSAHCAEADHLLEVLAEQDLALVQGSQPNTLSIKNLCKLPEVRQKNILRVWLYRQHFLLPKTVKLNHILKDVVLARHDAQSCVHWKNVEIRKYRDDLYVMEPLHPHDINRQLIWAWDKEEKLTLPAQLGVLQCKKVMGRGMAISLLSSQPLIVRFRRNGENCRLKGHTCSLKKLFQDWEIPAWKRNRVPLIFKGETVVMMVGYAICDGWRAREGEEGLVVELIEN
jgi:tRNA(Ile)-lysidine synthase